MITTLTCPQCDGDLTTCSPSGNGIAGCDNCHTYWDEGAYLVPNTTTFRSMPEAIGYAESRGLEEVIFCPGATATKVASAVCHTTGRGWVRGHCVSIEDGIVTAVEPTDHRWSDRELLRETVPLLTRPKMGTRLPKEAVEAIKNWREK